MRPLYTTPHEKTGACCLVLVLFWWTNAAGASESFDRLLHNYLLHWQDFYPSEALSNGLKAAAFEFEDFSGHRVRQWIAFNDRTLKEIDAVAGYPDINQQIDARVLRRQVLLELERWREDEVLSNSAIWYAELISQALTYILVRDQLTEEEKLDAVSQRLEGISALCRQGLANLVNGSPQRSGRAIGILQRSAGFYREQLPEIVRSWDGGAEYPGMPAAMAKAGESITALTGHIEQGVLPDASIPDRYPPADYRRKLAIHLDDPIRPARLAGDALEEISTVRRLMAAEARAWWLEQRPDAPLPAGEQELLQKVMRVMEEDRHDNRRAFLDFFVTLTDRAETFVIEKRLATVPMPRTLYIGLSPEHFSGAAYGGVYPTGPFNAGADTLFYLPTIPDDSPAAQKSGFYRSFNRHFNTMIIAHEMLPGHYLQYKVAVSHAPALRSLFANGVYVEGWGSFSEELMLDAGWGGNNRLTRLAHLRKRLENAIRAYVSVMVHVKGWDRQQLMDFATGRGLLAPQFAINLWNRVMNSPFQIPTYYRGFHGFRTLWQEERERLGRDFSTRNFVDRVLRAGPVPMDVLGSLLR